MAPFYRAFLARRLPCAHGARVTFHDPEPRPVKDCRETAAHLQFKE